MSADVLPARRRSWRRRRTEAGYAAVVTALLASTVFLGMSAMGVDTARWYLELERVQKAADAAALAGVTYMPSDLANARATALSAAKKNGYDDARADIVVKVAVGVKPSQLVVTISSEVHNTFGSFIGVDHSWMTRSSIADYTAPAPMGSPCNTFGNEPRGAAGSSAPGPTGTALPGSSTFASCPKNGSTNTSRPLFWGSVEGPETDKVQGDRYQALACTQTGNAGTTYGCSGGKNAEYRQDGIYFAVHVEQGAVGNPIELQVYDPSFVDTGSYCEGDIFGNTSGTYKDYNGYWAGAGFTLMPRASTIADNMNPYSPAGSKVRYGAWKQRGTATSTSDPTPLDYSGTDANTGATEYCTGDSFPASRDLTRENQSQNPATRTKFVETGCTATPAASRSNPCYSTPAATTFVLRHQTDSNDPTAAEASYPSCIKQFRGFDRQPQVADLKSGTGTYNQQLAQVFHQWVSLCTFTPDKAGNYFLQVRTDVSLGGTSTTNTNGLSSMIYSGNSAATAASGNTTSGAGSNGFTIRAVMSSDTLRKLVSVSGWERMPLLQNSPSSTATFNLVRALPNAKGQFIAFDFYDAADGATSGSVKVLAPLDASGSVTSGSGVANCKGGIDDTAPTAYSALSGCSIGVVGTTTDGHVEHVVVPIPNDYSCDSSTLGGCWFRVQMSYSGPVTDFTTWSASVGGDPVRLIG